MRATKHATIGFTQYSVNKLNFKRKENNRLKTYKKAAVKLQAFVINEEIIYIKVST